MPLDTLDRRILRELQSSADLSMQQLGERVGLSHTP
ncbi:MAG: Lrp/AsnC family transcriptional regulator, partial [Gammaproteobacteria bacterium]|nr:Lrp/AsnC family transcriptional regulator [Gammaproteobacteria bacterium]